MTLDRGNATADTYSGESASSAVSGTVSDSSGNPIEQATVTVENESGVVSQPEVDSTGSYESINLADGDYTVTASADGRETKSKQVTISGGDVTADFALSPELSGTVENQDGQPVEGATVRMMAVNYDELDVDPSEYEQRADEILADAQNVTPPEWNPEPDLKGNWSRSSGKYVAMHTKSDWNVQGHRISQLGSVLTPNAVTLSEPRVQLSTGETAVFSVWDASGGGWAQDSADEDLPGETSSGTVVIQQLGAGGDPLGETQKVETDGMVELTTTFQPTGKTHEAASANLPAGFYRVYPESNPGASYVVTVGDPSSIVTGWQDGLETQAGNLEDRAQQLREWRNQSKIDYQTTTTDANGEWEIAVNSSRVDEAAVIGYERPAGMNTDSRNVTMSDIRAFYQTTDYNGSFVLPAEQTTTDVPASGVIVRVREVDAPPYADLSRFQNVTDEFWELLQDESYSEAVALINDNLGQISDEEKREHLRNLRRIADLEDRKDPDNLNSEQLNDRIADLESTIADLQATIDNGNIEDDVTNETVSLSFPFETDLAADQVAVLVHYSNGTTRSLSPANSSYVSVEQNTFGGDSVEIEDYPLGKGDAAIANFDVLVSNDDGFGRATKRITNPAFDGKVPALDGIDLTTLHPGPNKTVEMDVNPGDDAEFRNVTDVVVYGPDGSTLDVAQTGAQSAEFTTDGAGVHHVRVSYANLDGDVFTTTYRVKAGDTPRDMPAAVRAVEAATGTFALTGDGLDAGSVELSEGGGDTTVVAQIGENADVPNSLHVYTNGVTLPPDATVNIRVARGEEHRGVNKTVSVTVHAAHLPDGAYIYRNGKQPVPMSSETRFGSVEERDGHTVIRTYTDENGDVTLSANANPGWIDTAFWLWRTNVPSFSLPFTLGVPLDGLGIGPAASGPVVGVVAISVYRRRQQA
jgi:hypothetical protein